MKILFWALLLGNVIFFAVMRWGEPVAGGQAVRVQPALNEEKITLLDAPQDKPVAAPPTPKPPTAARAPALPSPETPAPPEAKVDALCMEWGEFSGADLVRATTALSALQLGDKLDRREVEYTIGYWVYIPPAKDKAAVSQKISQLKERGIDEYFVVSEAGPWLNAISLGVFKTREAAQHFLENLRQTKDVRTAHVGERASKLKATRFVLNGLGAATATRLAEIQKDFAGSELKQTPCALTR